jgi:type III restriction enzyme
MVSVFNHDAWSGRIKHLVNEILEIERRLSSTVNPASPYNFDIHNLSYDRIEDTSEYAKKGEYRLLQQGFVELPTQVEAEDVTVDFERAVTGEHVKFKTRIEHKTWEVEEVADQMFQRLKSIDEESKDSDDPKERTHYARKFPLKRCEQIVRESLKLAKVRTGRVTDETRQKFLQALGTLRRKTAKRVVYKLSPKALMVLSTSERQAVSCSAPELRSGWKTVFYTPISESTLDDEQKEFFREVEDPDGDFVNGSVRIENAAYFKTPANIAIADGTPERKFLRELTSPEVAARLDAWLKNTPVGFYSLEYAWKKGNKPKRGEFSPDFFIKQGESIYVTEIKGDEEIAEPSPENVKKHEYAMEHFQRLNDWLEKNGITTRYQFNMLSPKDFGKYFTVLKDRQLDGFRSELDWKIVGAGTTG